jgi:NADH-quinone oxidoreductase subunit J
MALGAIISGIVMITRKNPVSAAMFLIMHFFMLAGLYLSLQAQFVAVMQILVYAGAIMVLVVFVIMLLNLGNEDKLSEKVNAGKIIGYALATLFAIQLLTVFFAKPTSFSTMSEKAITIGTVEAIGDSLFTKFLFPFEAISLLLLVAIVGSVLLSKRKI